MSLPKISHPKFPFVTPSGVKTEFRPFTGREQKELLVAKESGGAMEITRAVASVLDACVDASVYDMPLFDLEALFIAVSSKSVGNKMELRVRDDGEYYDAVVDLDSMKMEQPQGFSKKSNVEVGAGVFAVVSFPNVRDVMSFEDDADEWDYLAASVKTVVQGDDVYDDFTRDEMKEWLKNVPLEALGKFRDYFASKPTVKLEATYTVGSEKKKKELAGLQDFFE